MSDTTSAMYDSLAEHYRSYSDKRARYIIAVDEFILNSLRNSKSPRVLDVGAGDGVRGMRIARSIGASHIFLFDSSPEMVNRSRSAGATEVMLGKAEALPSFPVKFDVILMLWNVLGHLETREKRIQALRGIALAMNGSSLFFLDVNNRHNGASYGWWEILRRVVIDTIRPDESRGDVSFNWKINGKQIAGNGHLFTMQELLGLLYEAGLAVLDQVFVDYTKGSISKNRFKGQIVLKIGLAR